MTGHARGISRPPAVLLAGCALVAVACDGPTPPPGQDVASVEVTPSSVRLDALGETADFDATARDDDGSALTGVSFTWSVSPDSVASVDDEGTVTAVRPGSAAVRAEAGGVTGSSDLSVDQEVATLSVSPSSATMEEFEDTVDFDAAAQDANGNPVAGTGAAWATSDSTVVTVDTAGVATATGNGEATVAAELSEDSAGASVTVDYPAGTVEGRVSQGSSARRSAAPEPVVWSHNTYRVTHLASDGSLRVLQSATPAENGRVTVEDVPTDHLPLAAESGAGEEIGRALIHGDVPEDGTGYAASIDSETTLEANVLSELRAMGVPLEEISTPGIAMAIDAEPDIEAIPTVAQGTRDYQEIYTRLLDDADAPLDAAAREEAALPAARDFAERRVEGASEDEAEARRDSAALAAYEDAGPNRDALAVASAAASTGFDRRVEDLSSGERLSLLRGVESFLLLARERLLDQAMGRLSLSASTESEVGAAIDRARSAVRDASSLEAMDDSVESAMEDAESSIREDVLGDVSGDASDPAERVFTDVPQEGRLGRDLEDAGGPAEIASAYLAHAEDVQDHAVSEARQANDRGADLDVEGLAQALTATTAAVSERRLDAFVADTLLIPDATHTWQTDTTGESTFPVTVAESTFTRPGTDSTWNLRIDTVLDAVGVEIDSATLADGPCDLEGEGEVKADLAWSDPVRDGDFSLAWKQVPWTERFDRPVDSCVAQEDTAILTTTDTTDTVPVTVVALQLESDQRFYVEYREPDKDTIRDLNAAHVRLGDDPRTNQLSGQMTYRASGPDQLRQGELDLGELPIEYLLKLVQVEEDTATGETAQQLAHVDTLSVSMVSEGTYSRPESEASSPWRSAVLSVYLRPAEAPRDE